MDDDHVVIVTGAARGLGSAMALGLLQAGRRVAGADITSGAEGLAALQSAAAAMGAADRLLTATVDIRSVESTEMLVVATLERFGAIHGLVNNAGLGPYGTPGEPGFESKTFLDVPVEYWTTLTDTNINGTFIMTRAVAPLLVRAGWGRIVNITTSLTTMMMRGMAPYGPVKAALETNTVVWAHDFAATGARGVTANVLVPGGMADTAMVPAGAQPVRETLLAPEIMVPPLVWLMSHASDGTTAQRIVAKHWIADAPLAANLAAAMAPAAWQ